MNTKHWSVPLNQDNELPKKLNFQTLKRLISYVRAYPKLLTQAILLLLVSTVAEVTAPILVKTFLDDYVMPGHFPALDLFLLGGLYIVLHLLSSLTGYLKSMRFNRVAFSIVRTIRTQVFATVVRKPLTYFDHRPTGSLVSRITNDTEAIKELFVQVLPTFTQNIALILGIFVAMAYLDWHLMLVCLFFIPTVTAVMVVYQRLSTPRFHRARSVLSRINATLNESIQGMKIIQLMNQQGRFNRDFTKTSMDHFGARMANVRMDGMLLRPMVDLLKILTLGSLLMYFGWSSLNGVVEIGVMYAFINYLTRVTEPVIEMTQRLSLLQQAIVAGDRVFTVLDDGVETIQVARSVMGRGGIHFNHMSFTYDGKKDVLVDIDHRIAPGQFHAVVGHTGSGKTTLMSLLLRFYAPQKGDILIDGTPIQFVEAESLRQGIGVVQQDPFVFAGTIRDNICLGGRYDQAAVEHAAKQANLHDFIAGLPAGYDTYMSERGANLSTGQRQLLTLARTLVHQPKVLILDEATANIDSETEAVIQDALAKLRGKVTIFAIAHRLSTIKEADQIMVLHQGRIVQKGSHHELMEADGLYRHMYELQQRSRSLEAGILT